MKQAGLIFWKDVRALWPHLCVYAVLLAAFAWAVPQTWPGSASSSFIGFFVTLLKILLGLSQFVLITSVIHADRLVGDEQFWITRPYRWQSLLGAKLLFVVVCVALPLVLMQWVLLHAAGLNPFTAKAGMASSLLWFALPAWLPLMVIASVTDSLAAAFTFMAALLVAWAVTLQFILTGTELRMSPPHEFAVFGPLFGILLLGVMAYQFARRRTAHSRIAIAVTLALFLLFTFGIDRQGFGAPVKTLIQSRYQIPSEGSLKLVFAQGPVPYGQRDKDLQYSRNLVEVKLPVRLEGLPPDARIQGMNAEVAFAANGLRYAGPWENASVTEDAIGFALPESVFDRVAGTEINLHIELIAVQMKPTRVERVVAADRFPGPMGGNCILAKEAVVCRVAYGTSTPTHVEARVACESQSPQAVGAWLLQAPPRGRPDPVVNVPLALHGKVCPGNLLTFTEYGSPKRFRLVLDVPGVRLRDYRTID